MSVLLRTTVLVPRPESYRWWVAIGDAEPALAAAGRLPRLGGLLEAAFDAGIGTVWELGRALSSESSAILAHAPGCSPNVSDLGLMMAWDRLVRRWAADGETYLVVCDDPWMFRHIAAFPGVDAGRRPRLWPVASRLAIRGVLARAWLALRAIHAHFTLRRDARGQQSAANWILAYGHPASDAAGRDAYFGELMGIYSEMRRVLHVDCGPRRARELAADGRTVSLHAWGSPTTAFALPFRRWRATREQSSGPHGWLVRRAVAREGGTGQAAAIHWQIHCQRRWLAATRCRQVAWPWENHGWERDFTGAARRAGARTIGYQHSVIGRQMINYSPRSNPDGAASIPDRVLCTGGATSDQLAAWGIPGDRLAVIGALRFQGEARVRRDAGAPVFLALPHDHHVAREMVEAARAVARSGGACFVVSDHPMSPFPFAADEGIRRAGRRLDRMEAVSAVVYAATTVGLEAVLLGLPTIRFTPGNSVAIDILPPEVRVSASDAESLGGALAEVAPPAPVSRDRIFAPIDRALCDELFGNREIS